MTNQMTSLERVFTTLGHKEPDRVPLFLSLTLHGAKELGLSISEYFSKAENVIEGQIRLRKKYCNDCYMPFFYGAIEVEAFGGEVIFYDDGPPNSGRPVIESLESIKQLEPPDINKIPCLQKGLETIKGLKQRTGDQAPIMGLAISPFSLPVMQLGFSRYLELMYHHADLFWKLMAINSKFCVNWANAQLEAGATAVCYFDPVSSPTIVPPEISKKTGFLIARKVISQIKGPVATHFASGNCIPVIEDLCVTGTSAIGCSCKEDLKDIKTKCCGKLSILGNLNGIEMRNWTQEQARENVKQTIRDAAPGGGFILSDNHGEIPWQVDDEILLAISDAVHEWGRYPIQESN
jgi:uroporphyrinogen decarboxylase